MALDDPGRTQASALCVSSPPGQSEEVFYRPGDQGVGLGVIVRPDQPLRDGEFGDDRFETG